MPKPYFLILFFLLSTCANSAQHDSTLYYDVSSDHTLSNYHPLFALLWDQVPKHTSSQTDVAALREAIECITEENYKCATYILLPRYNKFDRHPTINVKKMKVPGGNNPVYWVTLRFALEGEGFAGSYVHRLEAKNYAPGEDPRLPTGEILKFAKHIEGAWEPASIVKRLNAIPEFAVLFDYRQD